MLNIGSTSVSNGKRGLFQNWMFQLMAIFAVGISLAFVGCGSDEEDDHDHEDGAFMEETIDIDGRQVVVLEGRLNADRTLSADYAYLLKGAVFVEGGATLTIEPGVEIFGEQASNGTLIVAQGSKIMANGTADAPLLCQVMQRLVAVPVDSGAA